jgi:hypothetical protein
MRGKLCCGVSSTKNKVWHAGSIPIGADFFSNVFEFPSTPGDNETHFPYQYVKGYPFLSWMIKMSIFILDEKVSY